MALNALILAASTSTMTVMPTTIAARRTKPGAGMVTIRSAAIHAIAHPKILLMMEFLNAFASPPQWKKLAHARKTAQTSRPTVRLSQVAQPARTPRERLRATSGFIRTFLGLVFLLLKK